MRKEYTHQDARYYVHESLGDYVDHFDVDGIITDLREHTGGSFDFNGIDHDLFWATVQHHEHPAT